MSQRAAGQTPLARTFIRRVTLDPIKPIPDAVHVGLHLNGCNRGTCSLDLLQGSCDILPGLFQRADVAVWTLPLCIPGGRRLFPREHQHEPAEEFSWTLKLGWIPNLTRFYVFTCPQKRPYEIIKPSAPTVEFVTNNRTTGHRRCSTIEPLVDLDSTWVQPKIDVRSRLQYQSFQDECCCMVHMRPVQSPL